MACILLHKMFEVGRVGKSEAVFKEMADHLAVDVGNASVEPIHKTLAKMESHGRLYCLWEKDIGAMGRNIHGKGASIMLGSPTPELPESQWVPKSIRVEPPRVLTIHISWLGKFVGFSSPGRKDVLDQIRKTRLPELATKYAGLRDCIIDGGLATASQLTQHC
jgi:hypothetical protein